MEPTSPITGEAESILEGFFRILKPSGTLHVIVPDLEEQAERYLRSARKGSASAADEFLKETLLSWEERGSVLYRLLEFVGSFGLQHRWMYDRQSISARLVKVGFSILGSNETPSKHHRLGDGSVHIVACKGPALPSDSSRNDGALAH